jgi:hypothetical protein
MDDAGGALMARARKQTTAAGTAPSGTARRPREVPRSFEFHWGGGQIVEEAAYTGRYTEPAIQLLKYEGGNGAVGIRFCYYNHDGRFQRSPMMLDGEDSFEGMRAALKKTPRLRELLRRLSS